MIAMQRFATCLLHLCICLNTFLIGWACTGPGLMQGHQGTYVAQSRQVQSQGGWFLTLILFAEPTGHSDWEMHDEFNHESLEITMEEVKEKGSLSVFSPRR